MSNDCCNTLTVTGSAEEVAKFAREVQDGDSPLSLDKITPMPERLVEMVEARGGMFGPDPTAQQELAEIRRWKDGHWGTRGLKCASDLAVEGGRAVYRFVTADSPAVAATEAAAERWDRLAFELDYFEPNADYRGRLDLSNA
jgi:hypothetical protein